MNAPLEGLLYRLEGDRHALLLLLGIHEQSYYRYKGNRRTIPTYIEHSIWAHMQMSNRELRDRLDVLKWQKHAKMKKAQSQG